MPLNKSCWLKLRSELKARSFTDLILRFFLNRENFLRIKILPLVYDSSFPSSKFSKFLEKLVATFHSLSSSRMETFF